MLRETTVLKLLEELHNDDIVPLSQYEKIKTVSGKYPSKCCHKDYV